MHTELNKAFCNCCIWTNLLSASLPHQPLSWARCRKEQPIRDKNPTLLGKRKHGRCGNKKHASEKSPWGATACFLPVPAVCTLKAFRDLTTCLVPPFSTQTSLKPYSLPPTETRDTQLARTPKSNLTGSRNQSWALIRAVESYGLWNNYAVDIRLYGASCLILFYYRHFPMLLLPLVPLKRKLIDICEMAWVKETVKFRGKIKKEGKIAHLSLWHQIQMMRRGTMKNEQVNAYKTSHSLPIGYLKSNYFPLHCIRLYMHYLQKHHSIHFSLNKVFKFMAEEKSIWY